MSRTFEPRPSRYSTSCPWASSDAEAWQIGLRALGNAAAQARESKLPDIGKTLPDDVDGVLKHHVATQLSSVEVAMARYFDANDGEVQRASVWYGAPEFGRCGNTVFVLWDPQDASSDALLRAVLFSATFMATRHRSDADQGDIEALRDVDDRIQTELTRIGKMRAEVVKIVRASETLENELRIGDKKLGKLLERAKSTLLALNVELHDRELEEVNPQLTPETTLEA